MNSVLVVDDNVSLRGEIYDVLRHSGYEVVTSSSGMQAIERLKRQRPTVILLDTSIPDCSALSIATQIRDFDEAVPIVLLQGKDEPMIPAEVLQKLGISVVIHKQTGRPGLLSDVTQVIKQLCVAAHPTNKLPSLGASVLVVDDEPKIQELMKSFLNSKGIRAITAGSGEEALTQLEHHPVAVVLLDLSMPGMDGLLALRKIKALQPNLPVIMVSAVAEETAIQEALEAGAYDYVTKPFNLMYLETIVLTKVLLGIER